MPGVRIAHNTLRSCLALAPILHKPFTGQSLDICPTCQVVHPVKTVHLVLDDAGTCIVSEGVLKDLQGAHGVGGLALHNLRIVNEVKKPPPLAFGGGVTREQVDHANRRIIQHGATPVVQ